MEAEIISIILKSVLSGKPLSELMSGLRDIVIDESAKAGMEQLNKFADTKKNGLSKVLSKVGMTDLQISAEN